MTTSIRTPRAHSSRAASPALALTGLPAALASALVLLTACFADTAVAQQVVNPGDIVVERTVTPRDAFVPVPRDQDPVAVRATTSRPTRSIRPSPNSWATPI
jgi:hypothetical protein